MKRNHWIILALAFLLLTLSCGTAGASSHTFTRQPADGLIFPWENTLSVSWDLDFTPVKTEVLSNGEVIDTLAAGVTARDFTESDAAYSIRAYYDESGFIQSDFFTVQVHWNYSGTLSNGMEWRLAVRTLPVNDDRLLVERGCLRIDGAGDMPGFSDMYASPWDQILRNAISPTADAMDDDTYCPIDIQLDDHITGIGAYSFNRSLTARVHFPAQLQRIGDHAFHGTKLIDVHTFPDGLQSIGDGAFENCLTLLSDSHFLRTEGTLTIPDSVTQIGISAFRNVEMEELRLPRSLELIPETCFADNKYLERVWLPDILTTIGPYAFSYSGNNWVSGMPFTLSMAPYGMQMTPGLVCFPNTLHTLGEGSFLFCYHMRSLVLPEGVTFIPKSCFQGCGELTQVTLPETLTQIDDYAFNKYYPGRSASTLPEITIPRSVTRIGDTALGYDGLGVQFSHIQGITIRGYRGTEAEDYITRQNDDRFVFVPLDTESLTLFGEIDGGLCGGEGDAAADYLFEATAAPGEYSLEVDFEEESHVGVRRDVDDRLGSRVEWYSPDAPTPGATSAALTYHGAAAGPESLFDIPAGRWVLYLIDNADGTFTLRREAVADSCFICGEFTDWEYREMTAGSDGIFSWSTTIVPDMSWSGCFEFYLLINDTEYTADALFADTVSGLPLQPREDGNGEYNWRNLRLAVSGCAAYTFTVDPASLTLDVTTDLETPGAFLVGFSGDYAQRMVDPLSTEVTGGEGGSEPPLDPYTFTEGTTLWASAYVYPDNPEYPDEVLSFYIAHNGAKYGTSAIITDAPMDLVTDLECPGWLDAEDEGGEYDFYYCPETDQLVIKLRPYTSHLILYTWCEEDQAPPVETWYSDDPVETAFEVFPAEGPYVQGDPVTVTAPSIPEYRFAAWYFGGLDTWWDPDGDRYSFWYNGDGPVSTDPVYTFDITDGSQLVAVYVPDGVLTLPAGLTSIEDEAFAGVSAKAVIIPDSVISISGNPFAGSTVQYIYGYTGSAAETFANSTEGLTFVAIDG